MALRVWLPLNGDLKNRGISDTVVSTMGTGVTFVNEGKIGKCASFPNNCNSCLFIPGLKLQILSWCCWFYCAGEGSGTSQRILSEGRDTGSVGTNIWISKAGTTLYWSTHKKTGSTSISLNTWYHVVLACDDSNIYFYLNGNLLSTTSYTEDSDYAQSNDTFVMGKMAYSYTNTSNYFPLNGKLNDVRIYDHCLSAKEVKEISQGLILHYKLDGFNGGVEENLATNTTFPASAVAGYKNGKAVEYNHSDWTSGGRLFAPYTSSQLTFTEIEANQPYTISAWVYIYDDVTLSNPGSTSIFYRVYKTGDSPTYSYDIAVTLSGITERNKWVRISNTFTSPATYTYDQTQGRFNIGGYNGHFLVSLPKVEKGLVATPWTPTLSEMGIDTTKIIDSSGYENDGTIIGNLETETNNNDGRYQISTKFPTNTAHIQLPIINYSNFGTSYTFTWWEYLTTVSGGPMPWGFSDGNRLNFYHTTNLCWNTGDGGSNPFVPNKKSTTLVDNKWHFIAISGDGTDVNLYIDSDYVGKATTWKPLTGTQLWISGWANATNYTMVNSKMSDFRIYATALSAEDILTLYHTPLQIDNMQNMHGFEFTENQIKTSVHQNGVISVIDEIHESNGELLNNFTSGTFTPLKNTNNSTTNFGIIDFSDYADLNQDLKIHIELDAEWTAFTADTGGTFQGIWFQGANYQIGATGAVWAGTNYPTSSLNSAHSLRTATAITSAGKYHFDTVATIPASWFATYNRSNFGARCDYSDGTGVFKISNVKITPMQYYNAKIGERFISADNFIEK